MDNSSRSERTRNLAIDAALTIIARDGPGRLTLDAIAKESGISKGGLMHQFRTKKAVLNELLQRQTDHFQSFSRRYTAAHDPQPQPHLAAQIATFREALVGPNPLAFALLGAMLEDPSLLSVQRESAARSVEEIKTEAPDPDLALIRWLAARGMHITALLGICPLSEEERRRLFDRLLDDHGI